MRQLVRRGAITLVTLMLAIPATLTGRGAAQPLGDGPTPRCCMGMAFDAARGEVVLFAGKNVRLQWEFSDTWTWDGSSWTRLDPMRSPPTRAELGMAYHAATQTTVVTGGRDANSNYSDTWTWDGSTWRQEPVLSPSTRVEFGMAGDDRAEEVVLFGGWTPHQSGDKFYRQTWTWDGAAWSRERPARSPLARYGLAMAFDATRGEIVMFGGIFEHEVYLGDTWVWRGGQWTRLSLPSSPSPRFGAAVAFDAEREEIVLFGGFDSEGSALSDTWVWDGTTWTELHPPVSPPPRFRAGMAFDAVRRETILFGGTAADWVTSLGDTWSWDGSRWTLRQA